MRAELGMVATAYVTDLGHFAANPDDKITTPELHDVPGLDRPGIIAGRGLVSSVVGELARDPSTAGTFRGEVQSAISRLAAGQADHPAGNPDPTFKGLGTPLGLQDMAVKDGAYDDAANAAYDVAQKRALFSQAVGVVATLPGETAAGMGQTALVYAEPALAQLFFPDPGGKTPAEIAGDASQYLRRSDLSISTSIGQGVVASAGFQPPDGSENVWWKWGNGKRVITDTSAFYQRWATQGESKAGSEWESAAQIGYDIGSKRYVPPAS